MGFKIFAETFKTEKVFLDLKINFRDNINKTYSKTQINTMYINDNLMILYTSNNPTIKN